MEFQDVIDKPKCTCISSMISLLINYEINPFRLRRNLSLVTFSYAYRRQYAPVVLFALKSQYEITFKLEDVSGEMISNQY